MRFSNDKFTNDVDLDAPCLRAFELEFRQDNSFGEFIPGSHLPLSDGFFTGLYPKTNVLMLFLCVEDTFGT